MQRHTSLQLLAIFIFCVMVIGWFAPTGSRVSFKQRVCAISLPSALPVSVFSAVLSFISVQSFRALYTVAASNGLLLVLLSNLLMIHWCSLAESMMADSIVVSFVIVCCFLSQVEHDLSYLFWLIFHHCHRLEILRALLTLHTSPLHVAASPRRELSLPVVLGS